MEDEEKRSFFRGASGALRIAFVEKGGVEKENKWSREIYCSRVFAAAGIYLLKVGKIHQA